MFRSRAALAWAKVASRRDLGWVGEKVARSKGYIQTALERRYEQSWKEH
jgi:hypothetical protein